MKKIFLLLMFAFIFVNCKAQTFPWAKSGIGTGGFGEGLSTCTDASGNVFIAGHFQSPTIIFGTFTLTNSGSAGNLYLVKYDANGNVLWAKCSSGTGVQEGNSVSADTAGNVYVTGYFNGPTATFGTFTLTNSGGANQFLTKYDANGNELWAKSAGGTSTSVGKSVSVDTGGNVYVTGYYAFGTVIFNSFTITNSGTVNIFLTKYDSNGNIIWAQNSIGATNNYSFSVSTDANGNIYIGGYYNSPSLSFGAITLTNTGDYDVFLVKYNSNGNVIWAKSATGSGSDHCNSVGTDVLGNIFITGVFNSPTISFGTSTLTQSGGGDMFLVKYDSNGNVSWARSSTGAGNDEGYCLSTYSTNVYVVGNLGAYLFNGGLPVTFGTDSLTPPLGSTDPMYIVLYNSTGNVVCASALASGSDDQNAVSTDQLGNAYISGDFTANPFIVGSTSLALTGTEDIFVAKYYCPTSHEGINEQTNKETISIYPNPFTSQTTISFSEEQKHTTIKITDLPGKEIKTINFTGRQLTIDRNEMKAGIYFVQTTDEQKHIYNKKIIIQ